MINSLTHVHPKAVGAGIVAALQAAAARPVRETEEDWIHLCNTAADEAYIAIVHDPPLKQQKIGTVERLLNEMGVEGYSDDDLREELVEDADLLASAHAAASAAFLGCMPPLTTRRRIRAYIACTAVALQRGFVTASVATKLLYAAQTALQANPKRRAASGGK